MSSLALMGAGPEAGGGAAFTPSSITGLQAWYKADAGTSTTTDGAAVSQWNDQSAGAHNATQATGANQPLYKAAIQNGLPAILFNGTTDLMDATGVVVAQPLTEFIAIKSLATTFAHSIVDGITSRVSIEIGASGGWGLYAGTATDSSTTVDLLAHTLSAVVNGASSSLFLDGSALTIGNPGANTLNGLRIGNFDSAGTNGLHGYIFEVLVYSGALSVADRQAVEGYLRSKWGTP